MSALRKEALQMVSEMPDEWILPIVTYMKTYKKKQEIIKEKKGTAYERLLSHAKPGIASGDYKKDLSDMLVKKYESIG